MNENIGILIQQLRKENNMTQKELANKLHVSDKAISKWECGNGISDIENLTALADLFDIPINDLLHGNKRDEPERFLHSSFYKQVPKEYTPKILKIAGFALLGLSIFISVVCLVADYYETGELTWSVYAVVGIVYGCLLIVPPLLIQKNWIKLVLVNLTWSILPFLYIIEVLTNTSGWMLPLAFPLCVLAVGSCWIIYYIIAVKKKDVYFSFGIVIMLSGIIRFATYLLTSVYLNMQTYDIIDLMVSIGVIIIGCIVCVISSKKAVGL